MSAVPDQSTRPTSQRDAAEILRAVLGAAPFPVVVIDREGRIRGGWNRPAVTLFGWSPGEARNRTIEELLRPRGAGGTTLPLAPGDGPGLPPTAATVTARTARPIPVEISTAPFQNAEGQISGAVVFIEDRSDRRTLEAQLRQAQKLEAVGQLAGGIAHDFNNLLTIVQSNAELLGDELGSGAASSEHLVDIQDAVSRGSELVRRLMVFGRNDPEEVRVVDLGTLVVDYADTLQRVLPDHIQVDVTVGPAVPPVRADPGALQQIILNLATNARDAMPRGGVLGFRVARFINTGGKTERDRVRLTVEDTGSGIEADLLEHVFEPFFTTKAPDRGTGLGLSMVRELTRQLGGTVQVRSIPGRGTTFYIDLPPASDDEGSRAGATATMPSGAAHPGSGTILVVEDDTSVRKVIRRALGGAGYEVIVTADGRQAMEAFRAHPTGIDLVLSDLVMPNMDGPSLYEALNRTGASAAGGPSRPVPFLFISGYGDRDPRVEELLARGVPVLHKPWSVSQLCEAVQDALLRSSDSKGSDSDPNR